MHYDDKVIGRAFRWSAVAFVAVVLIAIGVIFVLKRKPPPPPPKVTQLTAPVARTETVEVPTVKFTDITAAAGITFVHNNGAAGEKLLPETMGGGCAFLDYDNDGDQDLLLVNSTYWPEQVAAGKKPTTSALYRNDGKGSFTDVTAGSGLELPIYGMGVAVGDFDNDGQVDIFITAVGENHLFRNLGNGKFTDVTASAGVAGDAKEWSTGAAFVDIDRDGDLDLFVANYIRWSRNIDLEVGYTLVGLGRAYGPPMNFAGTFPYLYRNDGNGKFTDISADSGVQVKNSSTGVPTAKSMAVAPVDINRDGWMDLIVANDTVQNFVFTNRHNGTFQEVGATTGIAFDNYGQTRGAMGIDTAHYRNNEVLGVGIGNFANEMTALYASQGQSCMFTDEAITEGIGPASRLLLKFGFFFFDYDLDGCEDILTANGHLEEEINKVQQSQQFRQPAQLFWNCGADKSVGFAEAKEAHVGKDLLQPIVGRGSAFADIDGDGDLDVLLTQAGGAPLLLRNESELHHNWLRLKLIGSKTNRDAIGAMVTARVDGKTLTRQVMPTRSYLSQSELPVTLGLGKATSIEELTIRWPDGSVQKVDGLAINKNHRFEQAK